MKFDSTNGVLTVYLEGDLDAQNASSVQAEIEAAQKAHPGDEILFDAENLRYISSAGLRVLLRSVRAAKGKEVIIQNVSRDVYDVLELTRFVDLMTVKKKLREISVEGCEIIGKGRSSSVYRTDPETIVKLYTDGVPLEKIKQEIDLAKKAFVVGIPTAISYDLVRCGDVYGVVFEIIANAYTVGRTITAHPDQFDEITEKFVETYKIIHSTDIKEFGGFPSLKETWHKWADGMSTAFTADETALLHKMIDTIPERSTMVHCDFHAGNVMYQEGQIVVIDMADIGYGHPIFDLAGNAFHARYSGSATRQEVHGMTQENMLRFWDKLLTLYFNIKDDKTLAKVKEMCDAFGLLRGALFPMKHRQIAPELKAFHVEETRKNLFPRIDWALAEAARLDEYFAKV